MRRRSFGLVDAMLLIVAVAIGLWVNRMDQPRIEAFWQFDLYDRIQVVLEVMLPYVATGTVALLGMGMRQPRPPVRRLARRPGAVACMVASAVLLLIMGWIATTLATGRIVEFSASVNSWP